MRKLSIDREIIDFPLNTLPDGPLDHVFKFLPHADRAHVRLVNQRFFQRVHVVQPLDILVKKIASLLLESKNSAQELDSIAQDIQGLVDSQNQLEQEAASILKRKKIYFSILGFIISLPFLSIFSAHIRCLVTLQSKKNGVLSLLNNVTYNISLPGYTNSCGAFYTPGSLIQGCSDLRDVSIPNICESLCSKAYTADVNYTVSVVFFILILIIGGWYCFLGPLGLLKENYEASIYFNKPDPKLKKLKTILENKELLFNEQHRKMKAADHSRITYELLARTEMHASDHIININDADFKTPLLG